MVSTRRNDPKKSRTSSHSWSKMRQFVKERDGYMCVRCGRSEEDFKLEVDHITPWHAGGLDVPENLQTLCKDFCHKEKTRVEEQERRRGIREGAEEPEWSRQWM